MEDKNLGDTEGLDSRFKCLHTKTLRGKERKDELRGSIYRQVKKKSHSDGGDNSEKGITWRMGPSKGRGKKTSSCSLVEHLVGPRETCGDRGGMRRNHWISKDRRGMSG